VETSSFWRISNNNRASRSTSAYTSKPVLLNRWSGCSTSFLCVCTRRRVDALAVRCNDAWRRRQVTVIAAGSNRRPPRAFLPDYSFSLLCNSSHLVTGHSRIWSSQRQTNVRSAEEVTPWTVAGGIYAARLSSSASRRCYIWLLHRIQQTVSSKIIKMRKKVGLNSLMEV